MRVAVLAHSFPRFAGDTHGTFVKHLSEALARRGHDVHVLVPWDPELRPDPGSPLRVHAFRYVWPKRWHLLGYSRTMQRDVRLKLWAYLQAPLYFLFATRALGRLVRRERIELVHAHWILPNGWVAARVKAATGVPYAVTLHGSDVFMAERNALFTRLARAALEGAAHVTSCSGDLETRLAALGGDGAREKIRLVANGTELPTSTVDGADARRRWGLPAAGPLVVAVGRLVDKKGFSYLLEAMPGILDRVPEARIVIGGGGELAGSLARRAEELEVADRVVFTGGLSHPEVLELVAAADVFVMPSVRDPRGNVDGLPIVVLEAMAAGRPVVASAIAGMPLAIADGASGRLVPEKDPTAIATAVADLLTDPTTAQAMGERARRRVETELNWDAVASIHDELYAAAR